MNNLFMKKGIATCNSFFYLFDILTNYQDIIIF
jgi:hypothetical protein